jgi:hypothetical protein
MSDEPRSAAASPPTFAKAFPRSAELDAAVAAFARGDYALARETAARLATSDAGDDVKRAARMLVARTRPDPLAVTLLALAALLLVVLSGWWIAYAKPPNDSPPAAAPRN